MIDRDVLTQSEIDALTRCVDFVHLSIFHHQMLLDLAEVRDQLLMTRKLPIRSSGEYRALRLAILWKVISLQTVIRFNPEMVNTQDAVDIITINQMALRTGILL